MISDNLSVSTQEKLAIGLEIVQSIVTSDLRDARNGQCTAKSINSLADYLEEAVSNLRETARSLSLEEMELPVGCQDPNKEAWDELAKLSEEKRKRQEAHPPISYGRYYF